jgi:hypothetical protein
VRRFSWGGNEFESVKGERFEGKLKFTPASAESMQ